MVIMTDLKTLNSRINKKDQESTFCTNSNLIGNIKVGNSVESNNNLNDDKISNSINLVNEDIIKFKTNPNDKKSILKQKKINQNLDTKLNFRIEICNSNRFCSSQTINKNYEIDYSNNNTGQMINELNNYVCVQCDNLNEESFSVSNVLNYCKNYIFKPYYRLVSLVGLRPLFGTNTLINLNQIPLANFFLNTINIIYTFIIVFIILVGYLLQIISCYREDGFPLFISLPSLNKSNQALSLNLNSKLLNDDIDTNSSKYYISGIQYGHLSYLSIKNSFSRNDLKEIFNTNKEDLNEHLIVCSGNLFTLFLIPDILNLVAYIFTIYLMRASDIEKTEHLLEKGFLQASRTTGWLLAHRKLLTKLRFFLYLAFTWFMISLINHILHAIFQNIQFTFLDQLSIQYNLPSLQSWKTSLLVFTVIALIVKDLICSVIIASYAIHCELNISFIQNLCRSLREKQVELQEFIKGIEELRKFLHYLNHEQSLAVSLHTITILSQLLHIIYKFREIFRHDHLDSKTILLVNISFLLWFSQLITPLIQASRLSDTCDKLRNIGLELRARPFGYQDTSQHDLDSFLIYTSSLHLRGKILHFSIKKSFLWISFGGFIIILLFLGQINYI